MNDIEVASSSRNGSSRYTSSNWDIIKLLTTNLMKSTFLFITFIHFLIHISPNEYDI